MDQHDARLTNLMNQYRITLSDDPLSDAVKIMRQFGDSSRWDYVHNYIRTGSIADGDLFLTLLTQQSNYYPMIPHPKQIHLIDKLKKMSSSTVLINRSRQIGMSTILQSLAIYSALTNHDRTVVIFKQNVRNSTYTFGEIKKACSQIESIRGKIENVSLSNTITFMNGSRIIVKSINSVPLRGIGIIHDLIFDIDDNSVDLNYHEIQQMVRPKTNVVIASLPYPDTMFHKLWKDHPTADRISLPWNVISDRCNLWKKQTLNWISTEQWNRDYNCVFTGPANGL